MGDWTDMKFTLFATLLAIPFLSSPVITVSAQEVGGAACATPGTVMLSNIPPSKDDLLPSVAREIGGYGRQADASNCLIDLLCVATDSGDAARDVAGKQCVVVRDRLVKAGFTKANIVTSRKNPSSGRVAGMV